MCISHIYDMYLIIVYIQLLYNQLCMHIYIYIYIYIYIMLYICMYVYVYAYIYMYTIRLYYTIMYNY